MGAPLHRQDLRNFGRGSDAGGLAARPGARRTAAVGRPGSARATATCFAGVWLEIGPRCDETAWGGSAESGPGAGVLTSGAVRSGMSTGGEATLTVRDASDPARTRCGDEDEARLG